MSKIYITGVSGVGKSTIVNELNKKGIASFDMDAMDDLCHWENKITGAKAVYKNGIGRDWLEAHNYFCDQGKLKNLLGKHNVKVVIAGVASNQDDFLDLFDKIFLLHCDEKTFLHRLNTRDADEFAHEKSEQEHILSWYKEFEEKMLKRGAVPINTNDPLNIVVDNIVKEINSIEVQLR